MKLKLTIPESLDDIKLSQCQKFHRTTEGSEDNAFVARQMVGIFCNIPDEVVDKIKATDYNNIVQDISKVLEQEPKFKQTFKLDGVKYGFIPKLDDITVGEKADLDEYLKDIKNLDKAMAVLYRPIKSETRGTYLIEDYEGKGESLNCSLGVALGASFFLTNLTRDLLNCTLNFIEDQVAHNDKLSQILEQSGVGINQSMHYLREISSNLTKWAS